MPPKWAQQFFRQLSSTLLTEKNLTLFWMTQTPSWTRPSHEQKFTGYSAPKHVCPESNGPRALCLVVPCHNVSVTYGPLKPIHGPAPSQELTDSSPELLL
jgi:hypothetical protein